MIFFNYLRRIGKEARRSAAYTRKTLDSKKKQHPLVAKNFM